MIPRRVMRAGACLSGGQASIGVGGILPTPGLVQPWELE